MDRPSFEIVPGDLSFDEMERIATRYAHSYNTVVFKFHPSLADDDFRGRFEVCDGLTRSLQRKRVDDLDNINKRFERVEKQLNELSALVDTMRSYVVTAVSNLKEHVAIELGRHPEVATDRELHDFVPNGNGMYTCNAFPGATITLNKKKKDPSVEFSGAVNASTPE